MKGIPFVVLPFSLVVPSLFVLIYILIAVLIPTKHVDDRFITEDSINLPFLYDGKTKENF